MHEESLGFEDLNLSFGQTIEASPQDSGRQEFLPVILIGAIPSESLIISAPPSGDFPPMTEGEKVVFRISLAEGIALFTCTVVFISDLPLFMVYVDYPQELRVKKIREAPRAQVSLPVILSNISSGTQIGVAGKITDISTSGAGIEAYGELGDKGNKINFEGKFVVGNFQRVLSIKAVILKRKKISSSHFIYGVEFLEEDENDLLILFGFIFNAMAFGKIQKVR